MDVLPCIGSFRDLDIEGTEASASYATVNVVNDYDNSAIDEGPASTWTPPSGPGPAEAGFYRCVNIGGNREIYFDSDYGLIYYWGTLTYYPSTDVYLDGNMVSVGTVFKPAKGTYFGDWNGDCRITQCCMHCRLQLLAAPILTTRSWTATATASRRAATTAPI